MPLQIVRGDIAHIQADALVNAANTGLAAGGGVCHALFAGAGFEKMQKACRAVGHCPVGGAVHTPAFALPAKYVIHAVGPIWQGGHAGEEQLLYSAYHSALALAEKLGCGSVALPLLSAGIYGYPRAGALRVAMGAITDFLLQQKKNELQVTLVIYDRASFALSEQLLGPVRQYIDDNYIDLAAAAAPVYTRRPAIEKQLAEQANAKMCAAPLADTALADAPPLYAAAPAPDAAPPKATPRAAPKNAAPVGTAEKAIKSDLRELLAGLDEGFSATLLRLIDQSGMTDVQAYKRANIDRKLFSKIRSNPRYSPSKTTVLAFAIALRLDLAATNDLLARAGYALSHANVGDVIVEYFIRSGEYDIHSINEVLFAFDQKLLGA